MTLAAGRPVLAALIANPAAGAGRGRRLLPRVLAALRAAGQHPAVLETDGPGAAERLAATLPEGAALAVLGGDGTLNQALNGVRGRDVPVAFLPCGSGNDAARSLGLPLDPVIAAGALGRTRETAIDLGEVDGRLFCNVAGVGLDGEVCRLLASCSFPARGRLAYVAAFLLAAAKLHPWQVCIQQDGGPARAMDVLLIAFANGGYCGGGMRIAPAADPRDGLLDTCTVLGLGRLALLRAFPSVYTGAHVRHPRFRLSRARALRLHGSRPLTLQVDGEVAGRLSCDAARPTVVGIAAQRQRFLLPAM